MSLWSLDVDIILLRILQGNRTIESKREKKREIDFKELVHTIVGAGKLEICKVDQQTRDPGKSLMLQLKSKIVC